jgi:hypothetical protein
MRTMLDEFAWGLRLREEQLFGAERIAGPLDLVKWSTST